MKAAIKSTGAVLAGLITVFALSHATDVVLEKTGLMTIPFSKNPLWLTISVTFYRCLFVVAGAYVTARVAPSKPMRHVFVLASIGFVLGILGAIAMWQPPYWYPVALIILGWPSALLGGWIDRRKPSPLNEGSAGSFI